MQSRNWTSVGSSQQKESRLLYFGRRGLRLRTEGASLSAILTSSAKDPARIFASPGRDAPSRLPPLYRKRHRLFGPWRWARPFILRKNPTSAAGARRRPGPRKPPGVAPACDREVFLVRKYFPGMPENGRAEEPSPPKTAGRDRPPHAAWRAVE